MGLWPVNSALRHLTEAPASEIKPNGSTQEVPDDEGSILPADYIPGNQVSPQSQCRLSSQSLNDHYHGDLLAAVSVVLKLSKSRLLIVDCREGSFPLHRFLPKC